MDKIEDNIQNTEEKRKVVDRTLEPLKIQK